MTERGMHSTGGSKAAWAVLTGLLEARTGQQLAANRSWRLDTALKPLMRERGVETLDGLVARLIEGQDRKLGDFIVDALLNQESSFFREAPVFDTIAQEVAAIEATGRRARIWSAGCATGQEPLSLAMIFAERQQATGVAAPEIVATDVSEAALARARAGRFNQFEIQRGLPIRHLMRWFEGDDTEWTAHADLLRMISFRRANLVVDQPPGGRFDIVLCRNVLLYLALPTKAAVFCHIAKAVRPEGLLVLGAGETVIGQTPLFMPSRRVRGFYEPASAAPSNSRIAA